MAGKDGDRFMAELIQREDSLNTGREKLNEAIKASDRAESNSDYAVGTAETALSNSESTQTQLDTIVIDGDSSVEAAQARVDADGNTYSTLKDRLDEKETEFSSKLARTMNGINNTQPVKTPVGFNWIDHPLKNKIFTDANGNFFLKDFNIRRFKPKGKIYYVDVNNGSDANDGLTLNTALQSVKAAFDKSDCTVIKVAEGFYNREQSMWGRTINKNLSIEALPGHDVLLTQVAKANWQPTEGRSGVYQTSSSNVQFILDINFKDANGDFLKLTKVSTADEVEANPGSYALVSGVIYVKTTDSRVVDNETIWRFTDADAIKIEGNYTLYLEGIKMYGGNRPLYASNSEGVGSLRVFAKDCDFKYSNNETYDVVHIRGAELVIFENCSATNGLKDGFNYYTQHGVPTNAIEINCVGKNNGNEEDGNDQGSTQHSGGKIIRINGDYNNNYGSNIADDGAGTQSWNLGCISFKSLSPYPSQKKNYYAYTEVDMWLDGCLGFDVGDNGSDVGGNGNIYIRNINLLSATQVDESSTVIEY